MPPKPHRVLLDRVSSYADDAAAYLRRRRHLRKPFARVSFIGGRADEYSSKTDEGKALFLAAAQLIDVAGPPRPEARQARAGAGPSRTRTRAAEDEDA